MVPWVDTATHTPHTTGLALQASEARRARVAWKVTARRQSRRDQARRRAPGMGIPVFAPAKKPQMALRLARLRRHRQQLHIPDPKAPTIPIETHH